MFQSGSARGRRRSARPGCRGRGFATSSPTRTSRAQGRPVWWTKFDAEDGSPAAPRRRAWTLKTTGRSPDQAAVGVDEVVGVLAEGRRGPATSGRSFRPWLARAQASRRTWTRRATATACQWWDIRFVRIKAPAVVPREHLARVREQEEPVGRIVLELEHGDGAAARVRSLVVDVADRSCTDRPRRASRRSARLVL